MEWFMEYGTRVFKWPARELFVKPELAQGSKRI